MDFERLFELLSDYFDEELESEICSEIDALICEEKWKRKKLKSLKRYT